MAVRASMLITLVLVGCGSINSPPAGGTVAASSGAVPEPMTFTAFDERVQASSEAMTAVLLRLGEAVIAENLSAVDREARTLEGLADDEISWMYEVEDAGGARPCYVEAAAAWSRAVYQYLFSAQEGRRYADSGDRPYADLVMDHMETAAGELSAYSSDRSVALASC